MIKEQNNHPDEVQPPTPSSPENQGADDGRDSFPIIGIGASAGGLYALQVFLDNMPADTGMAFVIVQHLDPNHESILAELLQHHTPMRVLQVKDGMRVEPNNVYVVPPNRDMALFNGTLILTAIDAHDGLRLPIDFLFRSLAEDQGQHAIGIVLSGTGTDGTLGLETIRGEGGMAIAQDPASAKFDGMPRSAITKGLADYILPPEKMPAQLIEYVHQLFTLQTIRQSPPSMEDPEALQRVFMLLRRHSKHDFSLYKQNTIHRQLERRMAVNRIENMANYAQFVQQSPHELDTLFQELLIGVTRFFRDREVFESLNQHAVASLFKARQPDQPIRVWVPGCATGEEAYSIAILIREQMSALGQEWETQIFATDINEESIATARRGRFPDTIAADITPERLQKFFVTDGKTYQISKSIREMVVFAVHSIIKDPPFSNMDLISCRNLLIYLGPALQKKIIPMFHYALKPGGFLLLGNSETLGEFGSFFDAVDHKARLFQRQRDETIPHRALEFAMPQSATQETRRFPHRHEKEPDLGRLVDKVLLERFVPACVVIDEHSNILYFHGKTGQYLEPSSGAASLNLLRMARASLRIPLGVAVRQAIAQQRHITHENIHMETEDGAQIIKVSVQPVADALLKTALFLVTFEVVAPDLEPEEAINGAVDMTDSSAQRVKQLEQELQSTRQYLQTTIEELETTNEELRSTNEELQSANEELQSTNEEVETSQEELQSVNEELVTVNTELQSKIEELTVANNDLNNLLANIDVGIVFMDLNLHVQRFNPSMRQIVNLIETDIGRPISDIVINLVYNDLVSDARRVLDTLIPKEIEVQTTDDRWYVMRISPYRTLENAIDGLVVVFIDVTEQKRAGQAAREAREFAESIVDTIRESLIVLGADQRVLSANRSFYETFHMTPEETEGQSLFDIGQGAWDIPRLHELLEQVLPDDASFTDIVVEHDFQNIGRRALIFNAKQIHEQITERRLILLAIEDITGREYQP
ncbi:chemotaxis protein CheB [Aggregatilinea lenta]|uniref:chemotaxis protein CheB n=1 Tax=Aggregatilinea lenta TaxID=913108 RepID=UPI000E5B2B4A|nr:chemotaxis protein CheB [Aggregatilinea lenta]